MIIGIRLGEVSIEVGTLSELAALLTAPEFKEITASLKNGNGIHRPEGNESAPARSKRVAANGDKASRETVEELIRAGYDNSVIIQKTGWERKKLYQLKYQMTKRKENGSGESASVAD